MRKPRRFVVWVCVGVLLTLNLGVILISLTRHDSGGLGVQILGMLGVSLVTLLNIIETEGWRTWGLIGSGMLFNVLYSMFLSPYSLAISSVCIVLCVVIMVYAISAFRTGMTVAVLRKKSSRGGSRGEGAVEEKVE